MTDRPLGPDEQALWARVAAGIRPLRRGATPVRPVAEHKPLTPSTFSEVEKRPLAREAASRQARSERPQRAAHPGTLDGGWDRRLERGLAAPDHIVDLHGLTLSAAHAAIEAALGAALDRGDRLLLLVTGRPPRGADERRGAIRAAVADWLAASSHRARIAAVRAAHARHGGAGALYVVLRRRRS